MLNPCLENNRLIPTLSKSSYKLLFSIQNNTTTICFFDEVSWGSSIKIEKIQLLDL